MEKNVGGLDRTLRAVIGSVLILLGIGMITNLISLDFGGAVLPVILVLVGAVVVVTATIQWCPPYNLLGVNTCDRPEKR